MKKALLRACGVSALVGLLTVLAGCWGPANVGRVSGKVTFNGQPLADAMITFSPTQPGGSSSIGRTDSDGNYSLMYAAGVQGAQQGENMVRITTYSARPAVPEKVPTKYNSKTELKREVKSGHNTFDFALEPGPVVQPTDEGGGGARVMPRAGAKPGTGASPGTAPRRPTK